MYLFKNILRLYYWQEAMTNYYIVLGSTVMQEFRQCHFCKQRILGVMLNLSFLAESCCISSLSLPSNNCVYLHVKQHGQLYCWINFLTSWASSKGTCNSYLLAYISLLHRWVLLDMCVCICLKKSGLLYFVSSMKMHTLNYCSYGNIYHILSFIYKCWLRKKKAS